MFDPNAPLPDFTSQSQEMQRQQQLAQMLRQQVQQSKLPQGSMVGNRFVRPSMAEYLPMLLDRFQAAYQGNKADEVAKKYGQSVDQARSQWQSGLPQVVPGRPELQGPRDEGGSPELNAIQPKIPDRGQVLRATMAGMAIPGNEHAAQLYAQGMGQEIQREDTQAEKRDAQAALFKQQKELQAQTLAEKAEEAKQRSEDTRLSIQQRKEAADQMAEFRKAHDETLRAIASMKIDAAGNKAAKPVPDKIITTLRDAQNKAEFVADAAKNFKPEYGGMGGLAKATMGTWLGGNTEAANWWKDYAKNTQLIERHAMFGSALTASEKTAWRDADISPGMNPKLIKENLDKRAALSAKMYERTRGQYAKSGYNVDEAFPPTDVAPTPQVTKKIGGKTYIQKDGQWYEQ